jgi:hypothetical protein
MKDVRLVVVDGKLRKLRIILLAVVEAVERPRIIACPDAGLAHVHCHFVGSKEFVHQCSPFVTVQLVPHIAGRIRERRTEAQHLLLGRRRVEHNRIGSNRSERLSC